MERILVVDDDKEIANAIEIYLSSDGFEIYKAYDGQEAVDFIHKTTGTDEEVQLIIMDVMMPNLDGIKATTQIREISAVPIIMLTAKSQDYDIIGGLGVGADDYITKPFNPLEMVARVRSVLRRYTVLGSLEKRSGIYKTGGLVIDDDAKTVS
ncbi:MAG: response regulator transcription factor, partial [Clostridiales Family XIII bacterium]|nr:response regulator transcription factor [Clostridiales Family XIII bacterium]